MNAGFEKLVGLGACCLFLVRASAQNFAIETIGFTIGAGTSTDGNFSVSGTMAPAGGSPMSNGDFAITGEFRSVIGADLLPTEELIVNGSFENIEGTFVRDGNGLMILQPGSAAIPGWTVTSGEAAWGDNTNAFNVLTPFGSWFLDLTGFSGPNATIAQTITTVPGRKYRLSLSLGSHASYGGQKVASVCAGSSATVFILSSTNTVGDQWGPFSFTFVATELSTEIALHGIAGGAYLGLDNVSVVPDYSATPSDATNLVVNGSFEIACPISFVSDGNGIMSLPLGSTMIPGWTTTGADLLWGLNGNVFGPRSPYGSLFLDLTGYHDAPPYAGVTQTIATSPNQSYQLSFSIGAHQDISTFRGPMTVSVMAGSASNSFTFAPTNAGNQWGTFTMQFTAESLATSVTFIGTASAGGAYLGLDNVSVMPHEPELRISGVTRVGNNLQFSITTVAGRSYVLESRASLESGEWTTVTGTETTGTGETIQIIPPNPIVEAQQFYRVKMLE